MKTKKSLIPRYNWDYKFTDFLSAFLASFNNKKSFSANTIENTLGQETILTTSGRTSLFAILKALNLPEGSSVGVPLFCCHVVFDAIREAGLTPKFIDINFEDYNLSANDLARKVNSLSAIIVVHMFGQPADMGLIAEVANGIPIIEDCAQSLFSTYKSRKTGSMSMASFFSFRSGKYISAGEGSAILCKAPGLSERIKNIVNGFEHWTISQMLTHCIATYIKSTLYQRPWYGTIGYPVGMYFDKKLNLTSKSGFHYRKIAYCDLKIISKRIQIFREKIDVQKKNALYFLEKVKLQNAFLPEEAVDRKSNYYQFALRFRNTRMRDNTATYLFKCGIDTAKYLDSIVDTARSKYNYSDDCPNAEICAKTILIIPHYYTLSDKDLKYIIHCLNQADRQR